MPGTLDIFRNITGGRVCLYECVFQTFIVVVVVVLVISFTARLWQPMQTALFDRIFERGKTTNNATHHNCNDDDDNNNNNNNNNSNNNNNNNINNNNNNKINNNNNKSNSNNNNTFCLDLALQQQKYETTAALTSM
ncbi:hypothetical protein GQX74_003040 [Glossina fuscipes]|nr:hypothetical protein GQX74_003040 [Glossina fuscipes]